MSRMCTGRRLSGACQDWCDWDVETRFYEPCRAICDYAERTCPDTACRGFVERCMPTPLPPSPPSPPSSTPGPGGGGEGGSDVAVIIGAVFGPIAVCLLVALLVGLLVYLCRKRRWCCFRRPVQNNQNNQDNQNELKPLLPPAAVQNLATTVNADHNVTIEFSDPSRQSTHFDISVTAIQIAGDGPVVENSGGRAVRVAAPANGVPVSHVVSALQPGTRYQVSVTPVRVEDVAVPMNGVANGHAGGQGQGQGHQGQGHVGQAQGHAADEGDLPVNRVSREFFTNPPAPTELDVVADVTSMEVQCVPVACRYGPHHVPDVWVKVTQDGADQGQHEPVRMQVAGELMEGRVEGLTPSTTCNVVVYATIRQYQEPQVELRTDAEPRQERTLNHAIVQAAGDDTAAAPIAVPDPEDHDPSQRFRRYGIDRIETDAEASRFTRTRLGHGSSSSMSDAALPEPVRGMHSETSSEGPQPPI